LVRECEFEEGASPTVGMGTCARSETEGIVPIRTDYWRPRGQILRAACAGNEVEDIWRLPIRFTVGTGGAIKEQTSRVSPWRKEPQGRSTEPSLPCCAKSG